MKHLQILLYMIIIFFAAPLCAQDACDGVQDAFNDDAYAYYRKKFKTTPRIPVAKEDKGMYTPKYYQGHPYFGYYSFGSYTGRSLYF